VERSPVADAARRAGVTEPYLARLIELGVMTPDPDGTFSEGKVRVIQLVEAMDRAGIPLEGLGALISSGALSLDFIQTAGASVFVPMSDVTFAQVSQREGVPIEALSTLREVMGGPQPADDDLMREDELAVLPLLKLQVGQGFRTAVIQQALRVYGDTLRRAAETEGEWWRTEVVEPMYASGKTEADIATFSSDFSPRLAAVGDEALLAIYHAQQRMVWSVNIVDGIALGLERAGLHRRVERPPAMCFLDITGYTRLTQEQGDDAAAALAEQLGRIVQRTARQHGGRPVKWLGDGVMLYFPEPDRGVAAALHMIEGVGAASLPPAHIGLHAGPVVFREGDYYGRTVNIAARIGEYARPGEVLVSQEVVDACASAGDLSFRLVGPVELKGVGEVIQLHQATLPA
jgi:adenylate cyclase